MVLYTVGMRSSAWKDLGFSKGLQGMRQARGAGVPG
jgi:hypothetical protein